MDDVASLEVLVALRRISRAIDLHSHQLVVQHGLTTPQLVLLKAIKRAGTLSIGDLATQVTLSHPTVTGIIDRLEKRGLVIRRRKAEDRRRILLTLATEGERVLASSPSPLQEQFIQRFQRLESWEQEQILSSLRLVAQLMGAAELDAAPMLSGGPLTLTEQQVAQVLSGEPPGPEPKQTDGEQTMGEQNGA